MAAASVVVLILGLLGPFGSPVAAATVDVPRSIDASGGTDVTEELARFLSSVPHGTTVEFPRDGRYRIEGRVEVADQRDLTIEGNGSLLFATETGGEERRHVSFRDSANITIRGLKVKGANPNAGTGDDAYKASLAAQHGLDFHAVKGLVLDGVTVTDVWGDFVYLGPNRGSMEPTEDVVIRNSTFERNGRQGIALVHARRVLIERNRISQTRRATFDLEPNGKDLAVDDVRIVDNDIGDGRLLFIAAHGRGTVNNVVVMNNRLVDRPLNISVQAPDKGEVRRNFRIIGNRGDDTWAGDGDAPNGSAAIRFRRVLDVEVRGNRQRIDGGGGSAGVLSSASCVVAEGNEFPGTDEALRVEEPIDCPASSASAPSAQPAEQPSDEPAATDRALEGSPEDDPDNRTAIVVAAVAVGLFALLLVGIGFRRRRRAGSADAGAPTSPDAPVASRSGPSG